MAQASYQQTNFLGGVWSPFYQGRTDHPKYRTAMNVCYNGFPVEEGAWTRRPGTRLLAPTFKGQAGKVRDIFFENNKPYTVEFTDTAIRFFNNSWPVITEEVNFVGAISTDSPAQLTLINPAAWAEGDEITFLFNNTVASGDKCPTLRQRTFLVTPVAESYGAWSSTTTYGSGSLKTSAGFLWVSLQPGNLNNTPASSPLWWQKVGDPAGVTRTFTLKDAITNEDIDGSTLGDIPPAPAITVLRILRLTTPYDDGSWANVRLSQNEDFALLTNGTIIPQVLQITPNLGTDQAASANLRDAIFHDGPYLDPIKGSVAVMGGLTGTVSVTINFETYDSGKTYAIGDYVSAGSNSYKSLVDGNIGNDPTTDDGSHWEAGDPGLAVTGPDNPLITGFQETDVGRLMRFFSQPPAWTATNYTAGDDVYYNNVAYKAVADNSNVQPDTDPTKWAVNPTGAIWTWGKITDITNTNTVSVQILGDDLLYNEDVKVWRLGVYSDTTGWPTCGIFTAGRFWLGGAVPNRFDATAIIDKDGNPGVTKQGVFLFAPTLPDGTVTDSSAIAYYFNAKDKNPIFWFELDQRGIVAGTAGGEWIISGITEGVFSPTSTKADRVTFYRCSDIEPKKTPVSLVFVQKFKRRVLEFIADVFTGRFVAPHLSEAAKHLTQKNVEELGYQEELTPILWARTGEGKLIGAIYRRTSMNAAEAPQIVGWHNHDLGHARTIESIVVGPNGDGSLDALAMVTTEDVEAPVRWVEQITTMYDEGDVIFDAWFLDGALVPDNMYEDTVGDVTGQRLTGLWYLKGKTLSVFVAGLDLGDFLVDDNGTIFVPYGTGVDPGKYDYNAAGAGAWKFTAAWIQTVKDMNLALKNGGIVTNGGVTITSTEVPTNPNVTSKIQSFVPGETLNNSFAQGIDWSNGRLALTLASNDGFAMMNLTSGAEITHKDMDTITGGSGDTVGSQVTFDPQGGMYCAIGSDNWRPLIRINGSDLTKDYEVGTSSSLTGTPNNNAVNGNSRITAARANANWLLATQGSNIAIYKGADGLFVSGNGSNDPGFQGTSAVPWTIDESDNRGVCDGAPSYGNNVASFYTVAVNETAGDQFGIYFVGVADGVPVPGQNVPDDGSLGKKGKGKKGFQEGGVIHTPTINNPLTYFGKIITVTPQMVDPRWSRFSNVKGVVVNQMDNSVITIATRTNQGFSAWSSVTAYVAGDKVTDTVGLDTVAFIANKASTNSHPNASFDTDDAPDDTKDWRLVPATYITCWTTGQFSRTNSGVAGLKWKVIVTDAGSADVPLLSRTGRMHGGLYAWLGKKYPSPDNDRCPVWLIDSATGQYYVGDVAGVTINATMEQAWDDQSQSIIFFGSYDSTKTGAPTALNSTVSATDTWFRLYVGNLTQSTRIVSTRSQQPNGYTVIEGSFNGGNFPALVGKGYSSRGQILRPVAPEQTGARTGPAFGKTRRSNRFVALLHQTLGIKFGTTFTTKGLLPQVLKDAVTDAAAPPTEPFSGMWRNSLEDEYSFDSMIGWEVVRPYPATVVSVGAFVETTDAP